MRIAIWVECQARFKELTGAAASSSLGSPVGGGVVNMGDAYLPKFMVLNTCASIRGQFKSSSSRRLDWSQSRRFDPSLSHRNMAIRKDEAANRLMRLDGRLLFGKVVQASEERVPEWTNHAEKHHAVFRLQIGLRNAEGLEGEC